ncbi:hypothetical protein [Marinitoga sp. 1138]|uniref:hypothetical protein n=1 Tax=Marinitoga sp. 1138 TaxID=1643334 RepID=UPI0015864CEA|nr:hypothetical protein [Marinitoga sp. 1138]NUU98111.1 hypothetical protein [Marinitoga sp. 1138]
MKRKGLIILFILILTISLFSDSLKMIKKIEIKNRDPKNINLAFTENEIIITPIFVKGDTFNVEVYSLYNNKKELITKKPPALFEVGQFGSPPVINIYTFENKFWIICGNEKNGDMEISEYIKKDDKYVFNKKLNLDIKSLYVTIDYKMKDKFILSALVNETGRKLILIDKNLNWYKDLITLNDFSGYLEIAEYKDKLYIFESTTEKSVSSFFGANSKYIKLKHTFDVKTYKLLKKEEKVFSDMEYYTYIYQNGKYAYFGNYGGKINIKRYDLESGKVEDINMEEIYPLLKEGKINYDYYVYNKNQKMLIVIEEENATKLIFGKVRDKKFVILWKNEIKGKNEVYLAIFKNANFTDINFSGEKEILYLNNKNYKINMKTGEISRLTDKPILFFKREDRYYGILKENNTINKILEIYELKLE